MSYQTQRRVGLSKLNFHKIAQNFEDTKNPTCPSNDETEDTEHFSLLCPCFDVQRQDIVAGIYALVH